ncbi:MAG TPA: haloacid dehalogenase type II [Candidatus Limnocylindrales bacterium]|nr:haloacid dehalogenase type II [Candidatus Limnocylindrales bacterium]
MRPSIDLSRFDVLTFDCYGTLIDWEAGLLAGLRRALGGTAAEIDDDDLLERYAAAEAELEGGPYRPYREILALALDRVAATLRATPSREERDAFAGSVRDWPPFADSSRALARLSERYQMGVVTNCDDDLFEHSHARLGGLFRWVITAQQAGAYKPSLRNFELALERIGASPEKVLHVAQSLYHDHVPAKRLGLATAWVNRRHGRPGSGATPSAEGATADLTVLNMDELVDLALGPPGR